MTIQMLPRLTRKAGKRDRGGVVAVLAEAFYDDPVFCWASPDDERRRRALPDFFALAVEAFAEHDETWCTQDGVSGAAIWAPAGVEPMTQADAELFVALSAEIAGPDADRWVELIALLDDNHPHHTDHHYLWLLGVGAARQGRGLGSALLRAVLDDADRTGTPTYLEATSKDNRRLYERHGFQVSGELAAVGGPPLWAMWREPQEPFEASWVDFRH